MVSAIYWPCYSACFYLQISGVAMNIIELAKQANGEPARPGGVDWSWGELEAFAALVEAAARADEREACAKVCESYLSENPFSWGGTTMAAAIRARGTT
jgi:hypothetical protein